MSRVDTWIRATAGVTVIGLAGIAGAISYSHMAELAHAHGETGWRAHMFPLSVDGIEIVASLVLLADRRAGRRSGSLPWAALVAGTGASFAANIAVSGADWIGRAVSGWPAFALLIAVKLLFGLLDHPLRREGAGSEGVPVPASAADRPEDPGTGPDDGALVPSTGDGVADEPGQVGPDGDLDPASERAVPDVSVLLPAAYAARAVLVAAGRPLTREALARQLRADGHAVSNARASLLLRKLAAAQLPESSAQG